MRRFTRHPSRFAVPKDVFYMRIDGRLKEAARDYAEHNFMSVTDVFTQALVEFLRRRDALEEPTPRIGSVDVAK